MRVRTDWKRLSIAALLLFLFAKFAISPPEYHRRSSSNSRSRVARTVRVDDHDHEHSLVASGLSYELDSSNRGADCPPFSTLLPPGNLVYIFASVLEYVRPFTPADPTVVSLRPDSGRGPPLSC